MPVIVGVAHLSRLGRNYIEAGSYIEIFFPRHNVRYIAVTDGVDSLNRQEMDITPFKNMTILISEGEDTSTSLMNVCASSAVSSGSRKSKSPP